MRRHPFRAVSLSRSALTFSVLVCLTVAACAPASPPAPTPAPTAAPPQPPTAAPQATAAAKPTTAAPAVAPTSAATPREVTLPKPELTSIKLGHSGLENTQFAPEFAIELGLYKKYGIDNVESFFFDGDGKASQALLSGSTDINTQGGGTVISSQVSDVPLLTVAVPTTRVSDLFVGGPSVKTSADLKGKIVAISQFGGESHAEVLLSLKALGLTADDVTIEQVGGEATRFAAMSSGSVSAAPLDGARDAVIAQLGFNLLVNLPEAQLPFVRAGITVRREFYEKYPNTVLAVVAASLEAQNRIYTDTDAAVDAFVKWTQSKGSRDQQEKFIREYLKIGNRDLRWKKEGFEVIRDALATQEPSLKDIDVSKAYTFEVLDKLQSLGVNDAVGVPKS